MNVLHNDVQVEVTDGINISQFLTERAVKHPKYIVFELDGDVIPQDKWETTIIEPDSDICTEYLSGGG